jgi:hypothetical protein
MDLQKKPTKMKYVWVNDIEGYYEALLVQLVGLDLNLV